MFCPVCSQQQVSEETRFCSRCGFLLTGVSEVIANGGALPSHQLLTAGVGVGVSQLISPRKRGVRQGAILVFSSLIIVPLVTIICIALRAGPPMAFVAFFLTFGIGILRMLYAALFESGLPTLPDESVLPDALKNILPGKKRKATAGELSAQQSVPISTYMPPVAAGAGSNWRETNDLAAPPSVTDPTTKLLQKEEE